MPTVLLPSSATPFLDYDSLCASIASWLHRSGLEAVIPSFITLAEDRMNRALRVRPMEAGLAETAISEGRIAAPTGTVGVKTLWAVGHETAPLRSQTFDFIKTGGSEGVPACYAWQGDHFYFDGAGSVAGVLYERIPALSSTNVSNWLLESHPSAYLFGALYEGAMYVRNLDDAQMWDGRFRAALDEINGSDMRDRFGGPLQARAR